MTVNSTLNKITYLGNGATTSFPFSFAVIKASDIQVFFTDVNGNVTLLSPSVYTITINPTTGTNPTPVGGNVIYNPAGVPIPSGTSLTVIRTEALIQSTSLANQGTLYQQVLEQTLDNLSMQIQQIEEQIGRQFSVPVSDPNPAVLPAASQRANKQAGFDSAGNLVATTTISNTTVSSAMIPIVNAATISVADALLGIAPVFNVLNTNFSGGADPNGVADSTTAIQAAISAAQAAGGGIVYFPAGTYKVTGTLAITASGVKLVGAARFASTINFANTTNDCITIIGPSYNSMIAGNSIENLLLQGVSKTGGRMIAINFCTRLTMRDVLLNNAWTGIEIFSINDVFMENILVQGVLGGASVPSAKFGTVAPRACYGLWWHAPGDGTNQSIQLTTYNVTVNALYSGADCFVWDGFATTWNADQLTALGGVFGMHILNTALAASAFPQFAAMHNFAVDGASSIGLFIEGGSILEFVNASIQNTSGSPGQGSADTNAVKILADTSGSFTNTISFIGGRCGLCKGDAFSIAGRNVILQGLFIENGATQTNNTQAAIHLVSPAQDITIVGCQTFEWGAPVSWKNSLLVDSGCVRFIAKDNNFGFAATKEVQCNSTDSQSLISGNTSSQTLSRNPASLGVANATTVVGSYTETGAKLVGGLLILGGTPGAFNLTTPTAAAIVAALQNPCTSLQIDWFVANATNGTATILAGTGVTFSGILSGGNFVMNATTSRLFKIQINDPAAGAESVTIYG